MNTKRAWLILISLMIVYAISVMQRTSLGVSGLAAIERFDITAAQLSSLAVFQLLVYAVMQIPTGVVIDRIGPKRVLMIGAALMTIGQLTLAVSEHFGLALVARILVGAGDATTFLSLIRLINSWFLPKTVPQVSQWAGNIGQLGQVLSALPLAYLLGVRGWTDTFVLAALCSAAMIVLITLVILDAPDEDIIDSASTLRGAITESARALKRSGTQLGFWAHFTTQSSGTVFATLWGVPFLVSALGYEHHFAASLLIALVVAGLVFGPVIGVLTARFPFRRSNVVLTIVIAMVASWSMLLAWSPEPPVWFVVLHIMIIGVGGPGSLIGFDFARSFNPAHGLGAASGIVNVGGFLASFLMIFLIGAILDGFDMLRVTQGFASDPYSLDGFRWAFAIQFFVIGIGTVMFLRARKRTRSQYFTEEGIEVAPLWLAMSRKFWKS